MTLPALNHAAQSTTARTRSPAMRALRQIARNPVALLCLLVVFAMVFAAIFADRLAPYPYAQQNLDLIEKPPSAAHWLGTDSLGRDNLSRLIWGARSAVFVIVMVTALNLTLGITLGAAAGYFGGWVESLIMRTTEVLFAFPGLLFVFFIAATIKPRVLDTARAIGLSDLARSGYLDYAVVIIALGFIGWAGMARLVRGQVLTIKKREYVIGAEAVGVPTWRVISRHILPNALTPIVVVVSMGLGGIALGEGYLSYLGIGLQPPNASWGNIMAENAGRYWRRFPEMIWLVWVPGLVLAAVVYAFTFLGDVLNEVVNPEISA